MLIFWCIGGNTALINTKNYHIQVAQQVPTTYTRKILHNPICSLCLLSETDHMLQKLAFDHLTAGKLEQVSIRNANEPPTENHFIKFLLITNNRELCRKIKDWRRRVLEAAWELNPRWDGVGMPHCFELFGAFQGDANKRPELPASFQRDLH